MFVRVCLCHSWNRAETCISNNGISARHMSSRLLRLTQQIVKRCVLDFSRRTKETRPSPPCATSRKVKRLQPSWNKAVSLRICCARRAIWFVWDCDATGWLSMRVELLKQSNSRRWFASDYLVLIARAHTVRPLLLVTWLRATFNDLRVDSSNVRLLFYQHSTHFVPSLSIDFTRLLPRRAGYATRRHLAPTGFNAKCSRG